jgi:hypothetical protein
MTRAYKHFVLIVLSILIWWLPTDLCALTAQEILDQSVKQNLGDSFRISLTVQTYKAKKLLSDQVLWLMAQIRNDGANFFVDFDSPPEAKGIRLLLLGQKGKEQQALMYLPALGKSIPLTVVDKFVKIGGSGLTMDDIQAFMGEDGGTAELVKEEAVDGRDCYLIRIKFPGESGETLKWISKNNFLLVKSQQIDSSGGVKRTFRVVNFFKTEQGNEFPREEEILIPENNLRILIRQESAVFGIEIPDEVTDPEKFGTFQWKL